MCRRLVCDVLMIKRWMKMTMAICKPFGHSFFGFFCRRVVIDKCAVCSNTVSDVNHLLLLLSRFTSHLLSTLQCSMCVRSCAASSFANISSWQSTFDDKCGSMWFVCLRFCNLSFRCRQIRSSSVLFHRVSALIFFLALRSSATMHLLCVSTRQRRRTYTMHCSFSPMDFFPLCVRRLFFFFFLWLVALFYSFIYLPIICKIHLNYFVLR